MAQRILALETDGDWVRAALAERSWSSFGLIGVFEQQRAASEPDLGPALNRLVAASGKPDIVISALPGEFVAKRMLTLPFSDRRRLQQVVPFALEEHLPFPVDDAVVAFVRVGNDGDNALVMATYVRKEELKLHLDLLARAGLNPKTVTLGVLALATLMARSRNGYEGSHLIVNVDHSCTSMVLIDAAGAPRAVRTIALAASSIGAVQSPSAVASGILNPARQMLLAHAIDSDQAELILTGSAAVAPLLKNQLAEVLALPVRAAEDFDLAMLFGEAPLEAARFSTCLAMLLGEVPAHPVELLNFRQGEFAFHGRTGDLAPLRLSAALAAGVVFFALIHFILGISNNLHRLSLLDTQIVSAAAPALGSTPAATVPTALRAGILDMGKQLKLLGGSASRTVPLDTLLAISRALPPGLPVELQDVTIDGNGIKVSGQADSFAIIDQVKKDLTRSGYFGDIQVTDAKASAEAGKVDFRLSAPLADSLAAVMQ